MITSTSYECRQGILYENMLCRKTSAIYSLHHSLSANPLACDKNNKNILKKFLSDSKLTPFKTTNVTLSIVKSDRANKIPPQYKYIVLRILTVTTIWSADEMRRKDNSIIRHPFLFNRHITRHHTRTVSWHHANQSLSTRLTPTTLIPDRYWRLLSGRDPRYSTTVRVTTPWDSRS